MCSLFVVYENKQYREKQKACRHNTVTFKESITRSCGCERLKYENEIWKDETASLYWLQIKVFNQVVPTVESQ